MLQSVRNKNRKNYKNVNEKIEFGFNETPPKDDKNIKVE